MSEQVEIFREMREMRREERDRVLPDRIAEILALEADGYRVQKLNSGFQYRINGKFDLYPVHRRWHHLASGARGWYLTAKSIAERLKARG